MKTIQSLARKEIARQRSLDWYYAHKGTVDFVHKVKERLQRWRGDNPQRYLLQMARARAKETGRVFDLKEEDIKIPTVCPALKTPFEYGTPYAASVDRVDPRGGYTADNVQVISRKANLMKQDASGEELREFSLWVLSTYQV